MSRPRKPTNVLRRAGAFKDHPMRERERGQEPKPAPAIGDPPGDMPEHLYPFWDQIKAEVAPGVLTKQDRAWLEFACLAWFNLRELQAGRIPEGVTGRQITRDFAVAFGRMGFNPSERSKVAALTEGKH